MKKLTIFLFASIFFFLPLTHGEERPSVTLQIYLFYAEDCPNCNALLQSYIPTLKTVYPFLDVKTFDIALPAYYEALSRLENRFQRKAEELPVLFIGDQMLSGEREVMEKLDTLIIEYQLRGSLAPALPPLEIPATVMTSEKKFSVEIAYFYQRGCSKCDRVSYLLKYLNQKYPHLHIQTVDLNTDDGKRLNETLSNRLGLPPEKRLIAPSLFIGNDYLSPEEITESKIEALIGAYEKMETIPTLQVAEEEMQRAETSMVERFQSFEVFAILAAGLIEGLNPCALATLVFFISYLTLLGRRRKEILWVGMGFTGAGFITHLLLGLGILTFVQQFSFFPLFSRIVFLATFGLSLVLGILSLYDYIQVKRGRPSKMALQVPDSLKRKIHRIIRTREEDLEAGEEAKTKRFFIAAVTVGFMVTLLQSTCTSQVYLPTILFVTHLPALRSSALFYLVLYNLVYILPLVIIFVIVYWGTTSQQLGFFLQRRTSTIKLFTGLFFFGLAGILLFVLL